ncbi:hypothetical protein [Amycolatopsis sp. lyj-108]|uniref:hypothetical protein n=1 Tax=Amycolatopsis sp. lyj-108 TaxID=2789286 RepID=UPI003979BE75
MTDRRQVETRDAFDAAPLSAVTYGARSAGGVAAHASRAETAASTAAVASVSDASRRRTPLATDEDVVGVRYLYACRFNDSSGSAVRRPRGRDVQD